MRQFLDYDPWTGLQYYTEEIEDGVMAVQSTQDCTREVDYATRLRNHGADKGISGHIYHYAEIPNGVALELLKKGINIYNMRKEEFPRFAREIETNYPMLKTTHRKAWKPS